MPFGVQPHRHASRRPGRRHLNELCRQAQLSGPPERRAAAFVVSHGAQENHAVSQAVSMHREVEGRAAEARPSGLNADTGEPQGAAVAASVTLTVGAPKVGLMLEVAWPFVGRLDVATDVGLAPCPHQSEVQWTLPEDFAGYPLPRVAATHKGSYGHLDRKSTRLNS